MTTRKTMLKWSALVAGAWFGLAALSAAAQEGPEKTGSATPLTVAGEGDAAASSSAAVDMELPSITPGPEMTLAQALEAADKRNITLEAARLEVTKAEAQLSQSYALILPAAQANMQLMVRDHADTIDFAESLAGALPAGVSIPSSEMVIMPRDDLKGTLQVGVPLINLQSWHTISAAKRGVELASISIEGARQQILLGVAQAYYMSLMARELIDLYENGVRSAAHHLKVAKARFEAGTGLRIDVIRAETDLESERQNLVSAHLSFDNARDAIGVLTGAGGLPMPVAETRVDPPVGDEAALTEKAVGERRDIQAKQKAIELMHKQLDASWMQFLPTLDAAWQLQYQFTEPGEMGSNDRSRWVFLFTLTVPIYNHFRYGDLDYKRAALRQAEIQAEDTKSNASMEVRKARRDWGTALSTVDIAERQAKLAAEGLTLVEASYNAGTGSSLDVTDARRTLSMANVNLAVKRVEAQIALLRLLSAVGEDMRQVAK